MPRGPKGERRPADVIGNAVRVMRIATGEEADTEEHRDPDAVARGSIGGNVGGKIRAAKMTPEERSKSASNAARSRWHK